MKDIGEKCVECKRSVAMDSGLFVNRIPADNGSEMGYLCIECQMIACDRCGEQTDEYEFVEFDDGTTSFLCMNCIENFEQEN